MNRPTRGPETHGPVKADVPRLIDLKASVRRPLFRSAVSLIQTPIESLLSLDRLNRCYADYHESLKSSKGARCAFQVALESMNVT